MAEPTVGQIETQVRDHGYRIDTKVNAKGVCTVTLKAAGYRVSSGSEFIATSGEAVGPDRYLVALTTAATRMLDYEYRGSKAPERPTLGQSRYA